MKNNKEVKISYWAAHLTTVVSVTLVLLIIGVIALVSIGAGTETRRLKEKIELTAVLADSVGNERAVQIAESLRKEPFARNVRVVTKEEALKNWEKETGENLENTFGVNPLSPEVAFSVAADYASPSQIASLSAQLEKVPGVETVGAPDADMVEAMNSNIEKVTIGLGAIALVMLIISFVLINNTVHLSVYARRFTIHTMQLVGATNGFIRRPFILNNMLTGILAGAFSSGLLALGMAFAPEAGLEGVVAAIGWTAFGIVAGGLVIAGALICSVAAMLATTKYLRKDYDELFK